MRRAFVDQRVAVPDLDGLVFALFHRMREDFRVQLARRRRRDLRRQSAVIVAIADLVIGHGVFLALIELPPPTRIVPSARSESRVTSGTDWSQDFSTISDVSREPFRVFAL